MLGDLSQGQANLLNMYLKKKHKTKQMKKKSPEKNTPDIIIN